MAWIPVFIFSFLAFALELWTLTRNGRHQNRRGLTGAEVARHLLDAKGFPQMSVDWLPSGQGLALKQLFLKQPVYEGKKLLAIARAAVETVRSTKVPPPVVSPFLRNRLWSIFRLLILTAWIAVLTGLFWKSLGALRDFGFWVFGLIFLAALVEFPEDWEVHGQAYSALKGLGFFDVDELVRLKRILNALRLDRLAQIFKAPADLLLD